MLPVLGLVTAMAMSQGPKLPKDGVSFTRSISKVVTGRYLVSLPEGYEANPNKKYPFILFLHGSGERGDDLNKIRANGITRELAKGRKLPFIVVSPQCPDDTWWDLDMLTGLLRDVERKYRIDGDREYLTGLSMGGFATWSLAERFPKKFAAIAPVCGGGSVEAVSVLKDVPIWCAHGDSDPVVAIGPERAMAEALQKMGANIRFDVIKGGQHDVWTDFYANSELYDWFLSHKRGRHKKTTKN